MNVVGTRVSHPRAKWVAAGVVLLALLIVPAPLLPPHRFAEFVQSVTGVGWKAAYFLAALGLQIGFYGAVGMLATFFVERGATARKRLLQIAILPVVVVGVAFVIRCVKAGHLPIWVNAVIPISACLVGAALGLGLFYRRWKLTLGVAVAVPSAFSINYRYANGVVIETRSPVPKVASLIPDKKQNAMDILDGKDEFTGCIFEGEKGLLYVNRGVIQAWPDDVLETPLKPDDVRLYASTSHHQNWLECIKSRKAPFPAFRAGGATAAQAFWKAMRR